MISKNRRHFHLHLYPKPSKPSSFVSTSSSTKKNWVEIRTPSLWTSASRNQEFVFLKEISKWMLTNSVQKSKMWEEERCGELRLRLGRHHSQETQIHVSQEKTEVLIHVSQQQSRFQPRRQIGANWLILSTHGLAFFALILTQDVVLPQWTFMGLVVLCLAWFCAESGGCYVLSRTNFHTFFAAPCEV